MFCDQVVSNENLKYYSYGWSNFQPKSALEENFDYGQWKVETICSMWTLVYRSFFVLPSVPCVWDWGLRSRAYLRNCAVCNCSNFCSQCQTEGCHCQCFSHYLKVKKGIGTVGLGNGGIEVKGGNRQRRNWGVGSQSRKVVITISDLGFS